MKNSNDAPQGERLGQSDVLGVSYKVGDLMIRLAKLNRKRPVVTVWTSL